MKKLYTRTSEWNVGKSYVCIIKSDFETMFTDDESNMLMEYHKDKVILMN
jgi:hypothetical protein